MTDIAYQDIYRQVNEALIFWGKEPISAQAAAYVHDIVDQNADGHIDANGLEAMDVFVNDASCADLYQKLGLQNYRHIVFSDQVLSDAQVLRQSQIIGQMNHLSNGIKEAFPFESNYYKEQCFDTASPVQEVETEPASLTVECLNSEVKSDDEAQAILNYYILLGSLLLDPASGFIGLDQSVDWVPLCIPFEMFPNHKKESSPEAHLATNAKNMSEVPITKSKYDPKEDPIEQMIEAGTFEQHLDDITEEHERETFLAFRDDESWGDRHLRIKDIQNEKIRQRVKTMEADEIWDIDPEITDRATEYCQQSAMQSNNIDECITDYILDKIWDQ